ncbi:MAG: HD domain-containing protein [candidate division KSB1 bacterium]|nr:HD domain-containing protein [candidate division KSB1 bacterium]
MNIHDHLPDMQNWFQIYAETYKFGSQDLRENTILKQNHTRRVCKEIRMLAESLHLSDEQKALAEITALFHDVGRFEQYLRYHTFRDHVSDNHAELGLRILQRYGILQRLSSNDRSLITRAIRYHNRAKLIEDETPECLLYARLLRDADKLDIYHVVTEYYHRRDGKRSNTIELDLPDTPGCSDAVVADIRAHEIVHHTGIHNLNDFKLLQMGWVFDINFSATLQAVQERQYLEKIARALPQDEPFIGLFRDIRKYIKKRSDAVLKTANV